MSRGKHGNHARGANHYRWNPGKIVSSHGYIRERVDRNHPLADPNGYAYGHILAWVAAGGTPPGPDEVIHHINHDKTDNRIENLRMMQRSAHSAGHNFALWNFQVVAIREQYASGVKMLLLSRRFKVPVARVSRIIRGETRLGAGGPISRNNRGKKAAGRMLDGREWSDFPKVAVPT